LLQKLEKTEISY